MTQSDKAMIIVQYSTGIYNNLIDIDTYLQLLWAAAVSFRVKRQIHNNNNAHTHTHMYVRYCE